MIEYDVYVFATCGATVRVEAETPEQAVEAAKQLWRDGEVMDPTLGEPDTDTPTLVVP